MKALEELPAKLERPVYMLEIFEFATSKEDLSKEISFVMMPMHTNINGLYM